MKPSMPSSIFFNIDGVVVSIRISQHHFSLRWSSLSFQLVADLIVFTQISSCINIFNLKKTRRAHFSFIISCSWLGIIMNSQWHEDKILVNYIWNTIELIIYYFIWWIDAHVIEFLIIIQVMWWIDAHVIEVLIIIQVHFNYTESLIIKRVKIRNGVYIVSKEAWK